jgi:hypothetical protein
MPKGTINFSKIDSDVNYTLESLGLWYNVVVPLLNEIEPR